MSGTGKVQAIVPAADAEEYRCPVCGASAWRADYYQSVHQGCDLEVNAQGELTVGEWHGDEETYDDGCTVDESYRCGECGFVVRGEDPFCVLQHDGFGSTLTAPTLDQVACPECGGSASNIAGCRRCCRDCGRPCASEKNDEGFHVDQDDDDGE